MTGPTSPLDSVGEFIRDRRQRSRLSLRELASRSKVSNAYLSQVERGLHQPSVRVLRAIADALELSSEQMMMYAGLTPRAEDMPPADPMLTSTERAIEQDERLGEDDRQTLLTLYRRLARIDRPIA